MVDSTTDTNHLDELEVSSKRNIGSFQEALGNFQETFFLRLRETIPEIQTTNEGRRNNESSSNFMDIATFGEDQDPYENTDASITPVTLLSLREIEKMRVMEMESKKTEVEMILERLKVEKGDHDGYFQLLYNLGIEYINIGDTKYAKRIFIELLNINIFEQQSPIYKNNNAGHFCHTHYELGQIFLREGDFLNTLLYFKLYIDFSNYYMNTRGVHFYSACLWVGTELINKGLHDEAKKYLELILKFENYPNRIFEFDNKSNTFEYYKSAQMLLKQLETNS